jgi:hypothetical protein
MSAEVSRRFGRVAHLEPLSSLPAMEHAELDTLAFKVRSFSDLPERYQHLILAAEATRERLLAEQRQGLSA